MPWSHKLEYYWFTPMNTASRSCQHIIDFFNFEYAGHIIKVSAGTEHYKVVLNVKHPYSRLVSLYNMSCFIHKRKNDDFEGFVRKNCDINNDFDNHQIFLEKKIKEQIPQGVKYLVKVENLQNDVKNLPFISQNFEKVENIYNSHILSNNYKNFLSESPFLDLKPWQSYYTQSLSDFVFDNLYKQFEIFNYNRNYWKDGTP